MTTVRLQELLEMCTIESYKEQVNEKVCYAFEHLIMIIKTVNIFYYISIFTVIILCLVIVINFIFKFYKRNDNSRRILFFILYVIFMSILCFLIFDCFRELDKLVIQKNIIPPLTLSAEYLGIAMHDYESILKATADKYYYFLLFFLATAIILTSIVAFFEFKRGILAFRESGKKDVQLSPLNVVIVSSSDLNDKLIPLNKN